MSSARLPLLIEHAYDLIFVVDRAGTITWASPSAQQVVGLPTATGRSKRLWEHVHLDDIATVQTAMERALAGGDASFEFRGCDVDGEWRTFEARAHVLDDRAAREIVLNARDVTEQRQAQKALADRTDQLRRVQRMATIGQFVGDVIHLFSNLLTVVIGESDRLLGGLAPDSPLRAHARAIRRAANSTEALNRRLLSFFLHRRQTTVVLNLNELLVEIGEVLEPLIGEKISLTTACEPDLWPVRADPTEIMMVVLNLATNARDAMPRGGRVTLATRNVEGKGVVVTVTDAGVGMDTATLARAFESGFTTKPAGRGTGIGLATVKEIVSQYGGWTHIDSAPGRGTTVAFGLPRAEHEARSPLPLAVPERPMPPLPVRGGETVLVVEDVAGVRELVRDYLTGDGYHVLEAPLPGVAERMCREYDGPIHALLTDVVMPEMSGLELAARVQTYRPGTAIIYMSGYSEPTAGDGGAVAPGAHFLSKPFDRLTVLRRVREALDAAGSTHG